MKKIFFLVSIALFLFLPLRAAWGFSVSPLKYELTLDPGSAKTVFVEIQNNAAARRAFRLSVVGVRQDERGRTVFGSQLDEAEKWFRPEAESITLEAGARATVGFTATVPSGAAAGAHTVGLAVSEMSVGGEKQVGISGQLVVPVTAQVAGRVREALEVEWLPVQKVSASRDWQFDLTLKNVGNIDVPLAGEMAVNSWWSKNSPPTMFPVVTGNRILPQSVRLLHPRLNLSGEAAKWPGFYNVRLRVVYGQTNQIYSSQIRIWYCPPWSIAAAAAGVLIILLLVVYKIKKRKKGV